MPDWDATRVADLVARLPSTLLFHNGHLAIFLLIFRGGKFARERAIGRRANGEWLRLIKARPHYAVW